MYEKLETVLLVCCDPVSRRMTSVMLEKEGFAVVAGGLEYIFTEVPNVSPTIALIDLDSAQSINRQTLELLRSKMQIPIICLLNANDEIGSALESVKGIMNDFLLKPIQVNELLIRIKLIMDTINTEQRAQKTYPLIECRKGERRKSRQSGLEDNDSFPIFRIDDTARRIYYKENLLNLSHKEYELLYILISYPGRVFSDKEILDLIWPGNPIAGENHVQQYIHRLRKKIEPDPCNPCWIINTKGFGYYLNSLEYQREPDELQPTNYSQPT